MSCLLVRTALSIASPWVLRHAIDDLTTGVTHGKLWLYAALIMGIVVFEAFFLYVMRQVLIGISREVEFELRNDLYAHFTRLPARYYQGHRTGDLMSRATNDLSAVRMVLGPGIMYAASTLATFVGTIVFMLRISPRLLLLSLVPLLFVSALVRYFGRRIHDRFESVQAQLSEISAVVQENLSGARVVRAYAQEPHEMARFQAANEEYLRRNRQLIRMYGSLYPGIQLLMGTGAVLVLWLGGRMVVAGTITIGEFVAFGAYLTMLHWPMIALGWVVNIFERGEASMGRIPAPGRARWWGSSRGSSRRRRERCSWTATTSATCRWPPCAAPSGTSRRRRSCSRRRWARTWPSACRPRTIATSACAGRRA